MKHTNSTNSFKSRLGHILSSLLLMIFTVFLFWQSFVLLRDSKTSKVLVTLIAIIWGGGGVGLLYFIINWLVEQLPSVWKQRLQPFVFVGPGIVLVGFFLALPAVRTLTASLFDRDSTNFIGLANYLTIFTQPAMLVSFRNNLLWIAFGASLTLILGLLIAVLADRSRYEVIAKSIIFMPMAISLVAAGVIWKFVYTVRAINDPQIGLLNAIVVALGGQPQAWIAQLQPWNNLFLIVIVIWLQTGYAVVLFSAAIKGIPGEILEAARMDGANEFQVFFRIMIPSIMGTIITVTTTVVIFTLKIFDIVIVMTGGQYGTEVIATQFYNQYFVFRNFGLGSSLAIILLIAVIPIMIYNLRQFNKREVFG